MSRREIKAIVQHFLEFEERAMQTLSRSVVRPATLNSIAQEIVKQAYFLQEALFELGYKSNELMPIYKVREVASKFDAEAVQPALEAYRELKSYWAEEFYPAFDEKTLLSGLIHYLHVTALEIQEKLNEGEGRVKGWKADVYETFTNEYENTLNKWIDWIHSSDKDKQYVEVTELENGVKLFFRIGSSKGHFGELTVREEGGGYSITYAYSDEDVDVVELLASEIANQVGMRSESIDYSEDEEGGELSIRTTSDKYYFHGTASSLEEVLDKVRRLARLTASAVSLDYRLNIYNALIDEGDDTEIYLENIAGAVDELVDRIGSNAVKRKAEKLATLLSEINELSPPDEYEDFFEEDEGYYEEDEEGDERGEEDRYYELYDQILELANEIASEIPLIFS